CASDAMDYW
nr:immunoglobulin heavy chain junction region [Mus musculus]